jgi:AcrR family transcriptional regulator
MASRENGLQELRMRILACARELFFRHGFARVTVDEIAAELRISKTTFYKLFPGKEELFAEVIRDYYDGIAQGIGEIRAGSAGDYLRELTQSMTFLRERLEQLDAKVRKDISVTTPRIWERLLDLQRRILHPVVVTLLQRGVEKKVVRTDIDLKLTARIVIMATEELLSGETLRRLSLSFQEAFQKLVGIFLQGILVQKA